MRLYINWEATYGRQLFTSVLRTFSTELGGGGEKPFDKLVQCILRTHLIQLIKKDSLDMLINLDIICVHAIANPPLLYRQKCKD